jgi:putative ABC transport system permease protein
MGVAALVAINAFNYNLVADIDDQAKSLLGADIVYSSNKPFPEQIDSTIMVLSDEGSSQAEILSMAYLPSKNESQFVRIRALKGNFPYYGELLSEPAGAAEIFRTRPEALIDESMMLQYGIEPGDSIRLGKKMFAIAGALKNNFGNVDIGSGFALSVYISKDYLEETALIQPGSLVDYTYFQKIDDNFPIEEWAKNQNDNFRDKGVRIETVEGQKENLEEAFSSMNNFLNLIALVSLLLACVGVASSVLIYVKKKMNSIAILRCLGMKGSESFSVYFIQIFSFSVLSVLIGVIIGSMIQILLPLIFGPFLPYAVETDLSWRAIGEGAAVGLMITILFALVPLIRIRKVSPLMTLRMNLSNQEKNDPLVWLVYAGIGVLLLGFLWLLTGSLQDAGMYFGGLCVAFVILFLISKLVVWSVRKFFPRKWNFLFRQGLSNLYRPNNQTQTLVVSIGLGTAILTTLFIIQGLIIKNVMDMGAGNQPNMILFGIETRQKEDVSKLTKEYDLPVLQETPIVTMQLAGWKGRSKDEWLSDTTRTARRWAINREARVSFVDTVPENDELLRGTFTGHVDPGDSIFISLADGYAESMDVDLGDEMVWNVQGMLMKTYVGSIRKINFRKLETRFFILFPTGVLERAPQFHVLVTKSPDKETTATYRNEVVKSFPNVSVIDLESILVTLNNVLEKLAYAIRFMAVFSILIGIIVLISSLFLSKYQRIQESVLMRTIGASRKQILAISLIEYGLLGSLASLTGIFIALAASFGLVKFVFELNFSVPFVPIIIIFLLVTGITMMIGYFNSREVISKSPLEVLRKEVS